MAGYITMSRALQVNMIVSILFTLPFFILGPHEFASLLSDATVKASQFSTGPHSSFLTHLLYVDMIKNCFLTGLCYIAQQFPVKAQKQVAYLFMGMWGAILPMFLGVYGVHPIVGQSGIASIPPPLIGYLGITMTAYALAMVEKPKKKRAPAKKK